MSMYFARALVRQNDLKESPVTDHNPSVSALFLSTNPPSHTGLKIQISGKSIESAWICFPPPPPRRREVKEDSICCNSRHLKIKLALEKPSGYWTLWRQLKIKVYWHVLYKILHLYFTVLLVKKSGWFQMFKTWNSPSSQIFYLHCES